MVRYKSILNVIEGYVVKCLTIAQMRERLANLTFDEQFEQLKQQNLLNPFEVTDCKRILDTVKMSDNESYKEEFFQTYGRRLFEGVKRSEPPVIDKDKYVKDARVEGNPYDESGEIELSTVMNQKESLNLDVERKNIGGMIRYSGKDWESVKALNDYVYQTTNHGINDNIKHQGYINKLTNEQKKFIKDIDKLMNKTTGLSQDTVLYRGGVWDIHLNVGDHSKGFKGYQSTTFDKMVGEIFVDMYEKNDRTCVLYKIYAPQGTKGISLNDDTFNGIHEQHEFLLARNTGFTVLDIDYENNIVEVVLDEPR